MMHYFLSFLMLTAFVSAFTPVQKPWGTLTVATRTTTATITTPTTSSTKRFMFSFDDKDKSVQSTPVAPLQTVADEPVGKTISAATITVTEEEKPVIRNVVKDMNTGQLKEVKWVDPAMRANTRPWEMSWWAYIGFGFPFVLLADDFFHFLPTEGPLAFFGQM